MKKRKKNGEKVDHHIQNLKMKHMKLLKKEKKNMMNK